MLSVSLLNQLRELAPLMELRGISHAPRLPGDRRNATQARSFRRLPDAGSRRAPHGKVLCPMHRRHLRSHLRPSATSGAP